MFKNSQKKWNIERSVSQYFDGRICKLKRVSSDLFNQQIYDPSGSCWKVHVVTAFIDPERSEVTVDLT